MRRHLTGPRSAGIAGTLLLVVASVATVVGLAVVLGAALGDDGEARVDVAGPQVADLPAGVTTFSVAGAFHQGSRQTRELAGLV